MKNWLLPIGLLLVLGYLAHLLLPWYALLPVGLIVGFALDPGAARGWWLGFLGGLLLWGGYASWIYAVNEGLMPGRMGQLLGGLPGLALLGLTALLGALTGGLGVLTGALARRWSTAMAARSKATGKPDQTKTQRSS